MPPLHAQMEYFRIFDRHEDLRWSLNRDIPWHDARPDRVSDAERSGVYTAALSEFTTLAASHNFLREFVDDLDFSCWVSIWFYEEIKHHYALRRWLALLDVEVPAAAVGQRAVPYPIGANRAATCTMNVISELRAARWYSDVSRQTREPVLAEIMRRLAADEARHAAVFAEFARRYVDADRQANLRPALEMAYFWLADPDVKHPADFFYPEAAKEFRIDRVDITRKSLPQANAKAFEYLSKVTGLALHSCRDIKQALRPLLRRADRLG